LDIQIELALAIKKCEGAMDMLATLNASHHLLCYDGTGQTNEQLDKLTDELIRTYGPGEGLTDYVTDQELLGTFQKFHDALMAAIEFETLLIRL
jgi:hypothetical protein